MCLVSTTHNCTTSKEKKKKKYIQTNCNIVAGNTESFASALYLTEVWVKPVIKQLDPNAAKLQGAVLSNFSEQFMEQNMHLRVNNHKSGALVEISWHVLVTAHNLFCYIGTGACVYINYIYMQDFSLQTP